MIKDKVNLYLDALLKSIVGFLVLFYLFASLFPATGYVLANSIFLFYYIMAFLLMLDRSINSKQVYFIRTWLTILILYSVTYAITHHVWVSLVSIPIGLFLSYRKPIPQSFVSGYLWGFWIFHYIYIFNSNIDFIHAVTWESFHRTVLNWTIIVVLLFAFLFSLLFKSKDDVLENPKYEEKMKREYYNAKDLQEQRRDYEIKKAEVELGRTTDPRERLRLKRYINKRKVD